MPLSWGPAKEWLKVTQNLGGFEKALLQNLFEMIRGQFSVRWFGGNFHWNDSDFGPKVRVAAELQTKSQSYNQADPQNPNRIAQQRSPNGVEVLLQKPPLKLAWIHLTQSWLKHDLSMGSESLGRSTSVSSQNCLVTPILSALRVARSILMSQPLRMCYGQMLGQGGKGGIGVHNFSCLLPFLQLSASTADKSRALTTLSLMRCWRRAAKKGGPSPH